MTSENDESHPIDKAENFPAKREYIAPKLEKLGTIRDLTRGTGMAGAFDSQNPPGQNKSSL
jgi:hypothetical protein